MTKTRGIPFSALRRFLEKLGYRHQRIEKGEVFSQSEDRVLYYRTYGDADRVSIKDIASTRSFLDDWGQLDAEDFDAFLESTSKPA